MSGNAEYWMLSEKYPPLAMTHSLASVCNGAGWVRGDTLMVTGVVFCSAEEKRRTVLSAGWGEMTNVLWWMHSVLTGVLR